MTILTFLKVKNNFKRLPKKQLEILEKSVSTHLGCMIWTMGVAPDLGVQSHPWLDMPLNSHLFSFLKGLVHPKMDILSSITQPVRPLFFFET